MKKTNKRDVGLSSVILLSVLLVFLWCIVFAAGVFTVLFVPYVKSFIQYGMNGFLIVLFPILALLVFILPILFRKKLRKNWMIPLSMICLTLMMIVCDLSIVFFGIKSISTFDQNRWNTHEELRIYMTEDLDNKIIGQTEDRIKTLLGEPGYIEERINDTHILEYFVNSGSFDPVVYSVIIKDGIAVQTETMEH